MATMGRIASSSPKLAGSGQPVRATPCGAISTFQPSIPESRLLFVEACLSRCRAQPVYTYLHTYIRAIGASIVVRDLARNFLGLIGLTRQTRWQKQCRWLTPFILAFRGFH